MNFRERAKSFHYSQDKSPLGEWQFEQQFEQKSEISSSPTSLQDLKHNSSGFSDHPPRWDSFRNRIMTDEQAAQKVRDDAAAAAAKQRRKSRWNPKYYSRDLSSRTGLAGPIFDLLSPAPTDTILDVGCGDGAVTATLAYKVPQGLVIGLEGSSALIEEAVTTRKSPYGNMGFVEHDLSRLDLTPGHLIRWENAWDWIFSKSTFHRILRAPEVRSTLFDNLYRVLKPGGKLVFECAGAGTVPEAITAFTAAMAMYGIPSDERRDVNPWFCPSAEWMQEALEAAGFDIVECKLHHEPNKVAIHDGSLEGWVRQLGSEFIDAIEPEDGPKRDEVVTWICDVLNDSIERKEDGTRWLGYVKLRVLARKKRTETPNIVKRMCEAGALLPGRMSNRGSSFAFT